MPLDVSRTLRHVCNIAGPIHSPAAWAHDILLNTQQLGLLSAERPRNDRVANVNSVDKAGSEQLCDPVGGCLRCQARRESGAPQRWNGIGRVYGLCQREQD